MVYHYAFLTGWETLQLMFVNSQNPDIEELCNYCRAPPVRGHVFRIFGNGSFGVSLDKAFFIACL